MLLISHEHLTQGLLETLLGSLKCYILIAKNLGQKGTKVTTFHEGVVLSTKFFPKLLIMPF